MTPTTLLQQVLQTHFNWHGARLNFLAHFLVALYRVKTVNLVELASAFGGQASSESPKYRTKIVEYSRNHLFSAPD